MGKSDSIFHMDLNNIRLFSFHWEIFGMCIIYIVCEEFYHIWDKVFKNGPSEICGWQPLKKLKWYGLLADHMYVIGKSRVVSQAYPRPYLKWEIFVEFWYQPLLGQFILSISPKNIRKPVVVLALFPWVSNRFFP